MSRIFKYSILSTATLFSISFANLANAVNVKNNVFVELGGNAAAYSINYERYMGESLGLRIGVGGLWNSSDTFVRVPLLMNKYWGDPNSPHKFETGLGITYFADIEKYYFGSYQKHEIAATATFGYKYVPKSKGVTFKIAFTPIFSTESLIPWLGISVGHNY